jgi:acyl carrier protein
MQQRIELASQGAAYPPEVDKQMQMFHTHQSETLRIHEQYLNQQSEQSQSALKITEQQLGGSGQQLSAVSAIIPSVQKSAPVIVPEPAPIISAPIPAPVPLPPVSVPTIPPVSSPPPVIVSAPATTLVATSAVSSAEVTAAMMSIVSEKTGYPQEMLEPGMDMESDLGIDSIKRVEILGAVQDKIPALPEVPGDELSEMRTLGEIVVHLQSKLGTDDSAIQAAGTPLTSEITAAASAASVPGVSAEDITAAMMTIVSEKTGYPQKMLEPGMDVESDLGIDSIKRVEILGAVQDKIPELPEIPGDELAEMRTLGQIIDQLKSKIGRDISNSITSQKAPPDFASTPQFSEAVTGQDPGTVFMSIISEKTGYPAEMLELGMDMEADLGIDSIKRVEIMWSLQEQFKELPQIGANEVAELRTVGQIIEHIKSLLPVSGGENAVQSSNLKPEQVSFSAGTVNTGGNGNGSAAVTSDPVPGEIAPTLLAIIGEKTGYPAEMLELGMDMEADLGIDSIKRVEIMWSLQEQLPHLPQVRGSEMSELRTLKEIVDHLGSLTPSETAGTTIIPAPVSTNSDSVKKNS